jgi:AcrR family transcriptional regulator
MSTELGLRERKKQQTRTLIVNTARELFAEHGFDHVTLADVAKAADVSEGTLFNYFPRKDDLVFGNMQTFQEQLLRAVRERPADESILAAFRRFVLGIQERRGGLLGSNDQQARAMLATMTRIVETSPTLLARESEIFEHCTNALAELIASETGKAPDNVEAWVAANALIGVHRALVASVRRQVLAGTEHQRIRRNILTQAKRVLDMLEHGLADSTVGAAAKRSRAPSSPASMPPTPAPSGST